MLIVRKNQLNNLIATVSMNKTLPNPYYLFSFQHIASKERVSFIPEVITTNTRYDKFRFTEGNTTNLSITPPRVEFIYEGQYYYSIYEQISSGNTNIALTYNKLESGRAVVIVGDDQTDECFFEPYISNNEEDANIIYLSEQEQSCEQPIPPTPSVTTTQTNTPSVTPTNTETPTVTPTNTQTETPTNTPTVTSTNTPTPSVTTTQTNTPTNTGSPTPTPTSSLDSDASAYLAAVLSAGGTGITTTVSAATNTMFVSLKSAGIYTKLDALYPLLGGTATSTKWNAKNPVDTNAAYRITWGGAPTYTQDKGVSGNGINANGDTHWYESGTTTGNTTLAYFISQTGNTGFEMGAQYSGGWLVLQSSNGTSTRGSINTGGLNVLTGTTQAQAINFFGLTRTNNTQVSFVRAGGGVQTLTQNTTVGTSNLSVGLLQATGFGGYTNRTLGSAIIGRGLTTTELGNLRDIITTFNTTLGRNI